MSATYYTAIELDNGITLEVGMEYTISTPIPATYLDPPEGGEIELLDVWVDSVEGATYEKDRADMGDWKKPLDDLAWSLVDDYNFIYDHMYELEENWDDV